MAEYVSGEFEAIAAVLEPEINEFRITYEVNRTHYFMTRLVDNMMLKRPISIELVHRIATTSGVPICRIDHELLLPAIERMTTETIKGPR